MQRSFREITLAKDPQAFDWQRWADGTAISWEDLVKFRRVLVVSEAGTGKTYECQAQTQMMFARGEAAFFLPLERIASSGVASVLWGPHEQRFRDWRASSSQPGYFFLDSIDELQLVHGSFRDALQRLAHDLDGALGRATIVVTSRPVAIDRLAFKEILPVPPETMVQTNNGEEFVRLAMEGSTAKVESAKQDSVEVALLPLADSQIMEFARGRGIKSPKEMLAAIEAKHAHDFARRPQDLIELCDDWRDNGRIRAHSDQVRSHVFVLLSARHDRREQADLSVERARLGAQRIALAVILARRLTIRHSPGADTENSGDAPLDPRVLLQGWGATEITTLLERPMFGEGGYGRVRFQHRSVMEYLAACQIHQLINTGVMSTVTAKRLLFGLTGANQTMLKPSMSAVAGWLALLRPEVFDMLLPIDPTTLLTQGDPESLTDSQRDRALAIFVERYGKGQWRNIKVPTLQVARLAQAPLAGAVLAACKSGVENPDVQVLLLQIIMAGRFAQGADFAAELAADRGASFLARIEALNALERLGDARLAGFIDAHVMQDEDPRLAHRVIRNFYPDNVNDAQLLHFLEMFKPIRRRQGGDSDGLAMLIETSNISEARQEVLLHGLLTLARRNLVIAEDETVKHSGYMDALRLLRTVCFLRLKGGAMSPELLEASVLSLRASKDSSGRQDRTNELKGLVGALAPAVRHEVFEAELACIAAFRAAHRAAKIAAAKKAGAADDEPADEDANEVTQQGFTQLLYRGALTYAKEQDWPWILLELSRPGRPHAERALLLRLAVHVAVGETGEKEAFDAIRAAVSDSPALSAQAAENIAAIPSPAGLQKLKTDDRVRAQRQQSQLDRQRQEWLEFWGELTKRPALALAPGRIDNTLMDLWNALHHRQDEARWDRAFLETHFGVAATNLLREKLMKYWRSLRPTVRSERKPGEKNTYLVVWSIGLMGVYAEAEDSGPDWAERLRVDEVELAARYALLELRGFPHWLTALAKAYRTIVERVIGEELEEELAEVPRDAPWTSMLLQSLRYGPLEIATLLQPRLLRWLAGPGEALMRLPHTPINENKLESVLRVLITHGDPATRNALGDLVSRGADAAGHGPFLLFWMAMYCRMQPARGIDKLLQVLAPLPVDKAGVAVQVIGSAFSERLNDATDWGKVLTPDQLLQLIVAIVTHVRTDDDAQHEGAYSPGPRDYSETARRRLMDAFMEVGGTEAFKAKVKLAANPLFAESRDYIAETARARLAADMDASEFSASELAGLYDGKELAPKTMSDMAQLLVDRLDDLQELMLRDTGHRTAWAAIQDENTLRPSIAREFEIAKRGAYTVDQEAVTVDGKETDIRLRSMHGVEATIELKVGEKPRSANDLRDAIDDQLVTKYMAPKHARAGCLLVTIADPERRWIHPETKASMDRHQLQVFLDGVAQAAQERLGGDARVLARVLNLTPRLAKESNS